MLGNARTKTYCHLAKQNTPFSSSRITPCARASALAAGSPATTFLRPLHPVRARRRISPAARLPKPRRAPTGNSLFRRKFPVRALQFPVPLRWGIRPQAIRIAAYFRVSQYRNGPKFAKFPVNFPVFRESIASIGICAYGSPSWVGRVLISRAQCRGGRTHPALLEDRREKRLLTSATPHPDFLAARL